MIDDPEYRRRLKARLLAGILPAPLEAMLWDRAHGKVKETVSVDGAITIMWGGSSSEPSAEPAIDGTAAVGSLPDARQDLPVLDVPALLEDADGR